MKPAQLDGDTEGMKASAAAPPASAALRFCRSAASASCPIYLIGPVQAQRGHAEPNGRRRDRTRNAVFFAGLPLAAAGAIGSMPASRWAA